MLDMPLLRIFQFPPPRGGEPPRMVFMRSTALFQFPPPRGGEPGSPCAMIQALNFNSRPREGANRASLPGLSAWQISIPAPARGRTLAYAYRTSRHVFQFPPPRGGEHPDSVAYCASVTISIPAPARGRTGKKGFSGTISTISIPAPARGRTFSPDFLRRGQNISIPAPARGRTDFISFQPVVVADFNSRPREGANR